MKSNTLRLKRLFALAEKLKNRGEIKKTLEVYYEALLAGRGDLVVEHAACWGMGDCLLAVGEYKKAETLLRKAIKLDATNPECHYFLGEALCKQRRFIEAIKPLRKAHSLLPSHPKILELLGWTVYMAGGVERGRDFLMQALRRDPKDVQTLCDLAVLESQHGNSKRAKQYALRASYLEPDDHLVQEVLKFVSAIARVRTRLSRNIH